MLSSNTSAVSGDANYIEDVFSTYLYTGNGNTGQTITNGIDLSTKGGLVWTKARTGDPGYFGNNIYHWLVDSARGNNALVSNTTDAQQSAAGVTLNTTGYSINGRTEINTTGNTYASWTFRKQPKFFDVVTWTGDSTSSRTIQHSLGSTPGCIIIKRTSATDSWWVVHRAAPGGFDGYGSLNSTSAFISSGSGVSSVNDTTFTVNAFYNGNSSTTWVAYIFAHDAGGFGLTGTDNVISCGSYTGNGSTSGPTVNLGYEPQYVLIKNASATGNWIAMDTMRNGLLYPNLSDAEAGSGYWLNVSGDNLVPTATGFNIKSSGGTVNASGNTYIYIAIRRGPMKVPTDATKVFSPIVASTGAQTTGFVVDSQWKAIKAGSATGWIDDRLRGASTTSTGSGRYVITSSTAAEATANDTTLAWNNTGFSVPPSFSGASSIYWSFGRAPSFFDEVCYTGSGTFPQIVKHNLGVQPEFVIIKGRNDSTNGWWVGVKEIGTYGSLYLNGNNAAGDLSYAVVFESSNSTDVAVSNYSGINYVAYLFASCPGVSKVGKYTGTGTTKQIDCGFTAGARFVLIKRTNATGDWYVWDTARGIVSGNDPYLLLNTTAAEVTSTDYIDTYAAGFELSSTAPAAINASGGTYIFLAIA